MDPSVFVHGYTTSAMAETKLKLLRHPNIYIYSSQQKQKKHSTFPCKTLKFVPCLTLYCKNLDLFPKFLCWDRANSVKIGTLQRDKHITQLQALLSPSSIPKLIPCKLCSKIIAEDLATKFFTWGLYYTHQ